MRILALALLAASPCWGLAPALNPQSLPAPAPAVAPPQNQTVTIPAGTRIPLSLASPITTKAHSGDHVRAVTGFPVTVGTQLAIPVGTYVEGVIDKVTKGGRSGPSVQMHFTRILFANGYGVPIDGANTQAKVLTPQSSFPEVATFPGEAGPDYLLAAASPPQSPTQQPPASHIGAVVAVGVAGAVAGVVTLILVAHHNGGWSGVLFDNGWRFEMVLNSPLSIDIASAAASPSAP